MPFFASIEGNFGYGRSGSVPGVLFEQIDIIASYLRNYMSDFRNPNFYSYQLDGNGYYISDGGGDMYDGGNATAPWLRSGANYTSGLVYSVTNFPSSINYTSTTRTLFDTDFYYASLGYVQYVAPTQNITNHPLTVLGTRTTTGQPIGWQVGGNSGSDTGGTLATGILLNASTIQGFTVHAFYRETYNATDPSHANVFMLLGHPNWNSVFGTISSFATPLSQDGCGGFFYTFGPNVSNILAIQTLLSKPGGTLVTADECRTVVQNFCLRIRQALNY
jgi:hypothetical protein